MRPVRELLVFHGLYGLAALLLLGFAPAVPFEEGVERFVAWLREEQAG